jgi:uncharacterized membrane protein YraQ (UPF0718 family)
MLKNFSHYLVYTLFGLAENGQLTETAVFFIYDTIKIFLMLSVIIFAVSVIRSCFPPIEKAKRILTHKREFIGKNIDALLGIVTPFFACSAVPLFIWFVEAGVPLGVTFSFLISCPMVNEVAVVLLWGLFGWKIAVIYMSTGLTMAIIAGLNIGRLKFEKWVEECVYNIQSMGAAVSEVKQTFKDRLVYARSNTVEIRQKVWLL